MRKFILLFMILLPSWLLAQIRVEGGGSNSLSNIADTTASASGVTVTDTLYIKEAAPTAGTSTIQFNRAAVKYSVSGKGTITFIDPSASNYVRCNITTTTANWDAILDINSGRYSEVVLWRNDAAKWDIVNHLAGTDKFSIYDDTGGRHALVAVPNGNVGFYTATPDSGTVQIAAGIGTHDFYVGNATTYSRVDAGGTWVTSSDSTKKRNIVRVDSLIDAKTIAQKILNTGIYRWQWNPDSIFVAFDSTKIAGWDTLSFEQQDSIRQRYIFEERKRVREIGKKKHFGFLAQEFGDIWENDPNVKEIDWQKVAVINWYATQELIKEVVALKQRVAALEGQR